MDGYSMLVGFGLGIAFLLLVKKLQLLHDKKQKAGELPQCPECSFRKLFDNLDGEEDA